MSTSDPHRVEGPGPHLPLPMLVVTAALLAAPLVGLLWVASYAKAEPRLFGFPFFFWYQFAWVFLAATCTSIAYQIVVRHERRRREYTAATRRSTPDAGAGR